MSEVKNPFVSQVDAKRYGLFRPRYHHLPFQKLFEWRGEKIERAIDIACGTGHSTLALKAISKNLAGCDQSASMLTEARRLLPEVPFYQCSAEFTPFESGSCDLINVSMAYQWLNQNDFLFEAKRLLKTNGILSIDNYGFTGLMTSDPDFKQDYKDFDKKYMTSVPRFPDYPDDAQLKETGLKLAQEFSYRHEVTLEKTPFIEYLKTRSNYTCLDSERQTNVDAKLVEFYESKFNGAPKDLTFAGVTRLYSL